MSLMSCNDLPVDGHASILSLPLRLWQLFDNGLNFAECRLLASTSQRLLLFDHRFGFAVENHEFSIEKIRFRAPVEGDRDEALQSTRFPLAAAGRWNHWWNEGGGQWLLRVQPYSSGAASGGHPGGADQTLSGYEQWGLPVHIRTLYARVQIQGVGVRELLCDILLHDIPAAAVGQGLVPRSEQGRRNHEGEPCQEEQASSPLPSQTSQSGNVQRAIPPWLDRVFPLRQRHTHQESECLGCAQWRQSREPEWVDVARQPNPGRGPNHETLPPAERESKQTTLTDQRFRTSYDNKPHTNTINRKRVRHHPGQSLSNIINSQQFNVT